MNNDTFFQSIHDRIYSSSITVSKALEELREAWKLYPESRARIEAMAKVLQIAQIKRPPQPVKPPTELEKNVMETML